MWKANNASEKKPVKVCTYSFFCPFKVHVLVTLDTVTTLGHITKDKKSDRWVNFHQTKGGDAKLKNVNSEKVLSIGSPLSRRLKGVSLQNADINKDSVVDFKEVTRTINLGDSFSLNGSDVNHDVLPQYFSKEAVSELNSN